MRSLQSLELGKSIYVTISGLPYAPLPERKVLYYDPPNPLMQLRAFSEEGEDIHLTFPGKIAGIQPES